MRRDWQTWNTWFLNHIGFQAWCSVVAFTFNIRRQRERERESCSSQLSLSLSLSLFSLSSFLSCPLSFRSEGKEGIRQFQNWHLKKKKANAPPTQKKRRRKSLKQTRLVRRLLIDIILEKSTDYFGKKFSNKDRKLKKFMLLWRSRVLKFNIYWGTHLLII